MINSLKKRFTIREYHQLIELGFFSEDEHIELIEGELIIMSAKGTKHTTCCTKLLRELMQIIGNQATLKCQDPIVLPDDSEPEPDLVIVKNKEDDYLSNHPTPEDIILIIEIAETSLFYDQQIKLNLYAKADIQNYWIFNLIDNQLETYTKPYRKLQGDFAYRQQMIFLVNQTISIPEISQPSLDLSRVFPLSNN